MTVKTTKMITTKNVNKNRTLSGSDAFREKQRLDRTYNR